MNSTQFNSDASIAISGNQLDAFSNFRTADPSFVADGQLTYDLQPLIYEQVTSANGTIVHDSTNRCATISLSNAGATEEVYMKSYQYYRYQAGRAQEIFMTFAAFAPTSNVQSFVEYGDGDNGIAFETDGTLLGSQFRIYSGTDNGDQTPVTSANWSLDKLDGTGASGITLDPTKTQIVVIDIQALYVGRVRVGFDIDGMIIWVHEFLHANLIATPYIQTANLPIRAGLRATGASATGQMRFICSCVLSRGGQDQIAGYDFVARSGAITAALDTRTHAISVRPKTTFNSITNRIEFVLENVEIANLGSNPVYWELVVGQALTTPVYSDANATYSAFEFETAATLSGDPGVVVNCGYVGGGNQNSFAVSESVKNRYPITLDSSGGVRDTGTLTLLVQSIDTGTSEIEASIHWRELR